MSSADTLVLAEHITDLASADTDIAGRHIGIRSDMAVELGHEALGKTHDFLIGFAFWIEIRAALAAADGLACERIFEDLFKAKEFDDAGINRRMEPDAAFVRTQRAVKLDAEPAVYLVLP